MCEGQNGEDEPDPDKRDYAKLCDDRQRGYIGCGTGDTCDGCDLAAQWVYLSSKDDGLGEDVRKSIHA
ncbi:hypothetical protein CL614_05035 [archaeon]|nr:hypothetical protein [archaeon]|tara:strand:+ start:2177 stop:2380 length:204 start_codon:yes stop_codon:yes gene_type:complete